MNLNVIKTYKKEFPNYTVGLSDHENGIDAATIAYMLEQEFLKNTLH